MALATNILSLATRVATEAKALRTLINGNQSDLAALQTTAKTNLVAAINELVGAVGGAGASIDDESTSTLTVWSSDHTNSQINGAVSALVNAAPGTLDTLNELAAALGDDPNFSTTVTNLIGQKANASHTHAISDITNLQTTLDGKASTAAATTTSSGLVELATTAEVETGTDNTRATTAAGVRVVTGNPNADFVATFEAGLV